MFDFCRASPPPPCRLNSVIAFLLRRHRPTYLARPKSSDALAAYLKQRRLPTWTAFYVPYSNVQVRIIYSFSFDRFFLFFTLGFSTHPIPSKYWARPLVVIFRAIPGNVEQFSGYRAKQGQQLERDILTEKCHQYRLQTGNSYSLLVRNSMFCLYNNSPGRLRPFCPNDSFIPRIVLSVTFFHFNQFFENFFSSYNM